MEEAEKRGQKKMFNRIWDARAYFTALNKEIKRVMPKVKRPLGKLKGFTFN